MKNLQLERPLLFMDLETTGLNPFTDRIVELTFLKINPDGSEESRTRLVNPQMHIPEEATAVHGITDADVADKPIKMVKENYMSARMEDGRANNDVLDKKIYTLIDSWNVGYITQSAYGIQGV